MKRTDEPMTHAAVPAGCLFAVGSAAITCLLLFLNGSLVMAVLMAADGFRFEWLRDSRVSQFLLFALPLVLAVLEWKAIDFVRSRFRRPPYAE